MSIPENYKLQWAYSRDLLRDGGGEGDIVVDRGEDKVVVRLIPNRGMKRELALFFDKTHLDTYLSIVYSLVPDGQESSHIDWDKEFAKLL